ncbi:hypothetical protein C8R43DRAFT_1009969 [Mycena crocata]|nr:hypothetical protein C8R43DRAFT_1009969 [Mycena crocata]
MSADTFANSVPHSLLSDEIEWRELQPWLETCGYMLRPRYRPGWTPSWIAKLTSPLLVEDGMFSMFWVVMDAIRTEDGVPVILKKIEKAAVSLRTNETAIGLYFSTPPRAAHPRNHCIPTYEVLQIPNDAEHEIIVMPALRQFTSPPFDTLVAQSRLLTVLQGYPIYAHIMWLIGALLPRRPQLVGSILFIGW